MGGTLMSPTPSRPTLLDGSCSRNGAVGVGRWAWLLEFLAGTLRAGSDHLGRWPLAWREEQQGSGRKPTPRPGCSLQVDTALSR